MPICFSSHMQVVNGIKYILKMELVPTNCSRPREEGFECVPDSETPALLFSLEVLEHPQQEADAELLSFREVRRRTCLLREARHRFSVLLGCEVPNFCPSER